MDERPKKTIQINPDFLKLPMKGNRTKKKTTDPKPIKIRNENTADSRKTIRKRINQIRKEQEERYKRLLKGDESAVSTEVRVETTDPEKTYADEFKSDFDDSLAFLQKLSDQNAQKIKPSATTLKQYPVVPNSTLFHNPVLNTVLNGLTQPGAPMKINENVSLTVPEEFLTQPKEFLTQPEEFLTQPKEFLTAPIQTNLLGSSPLMPSLQVPPPPMYGCLKGGKLPTYRTFKNLGQTTSNSTAPLRNEPSSSSIPSVNMNGGSKNLNKLTPEQQRAELKQFIEKRKEEKQRVERVKKQHRMLKPPKKQKRTTTRTFRVGKSKHYPRVGVLISNKTIRTQVLAKKQKIREASMEDVRKYLIKKGLIRVGSSCPNDVLRKMYESSMMMCGEIQNHNPDNLLYNYLNNAI
jgi:hypothetical protein